MVLFLYYLKPLLFCLLLIAASAVDIKRREIPDGISFCITGLALWGLCPENLLGILAALPFLIAALSGGMGGGDVKLVASCGLVVGLPGALCGSILGLIILLLYSLVHRIGVCLFHGKASAAFPMAPFLSVGFMISYLLGLGGMAK
ncbi:prepilin peptidase [Enterocloster bolteae]|uniref:prepilin peptidase n=1 Tax=Clostridia TaxID=186801 RepID=UPI001D095233|nr:MULTISPECIES: prepilin peptidase [Clostridia]MCB6928312.1 prepilin peptidase [Enterocloster bolteae]